MALATEILVPQFSSIILSIGSHGLGLVATQMAHKLSMQYVMPVCT
jgi:hypothetical protein